MCGPSVKQSGARFGFAGQESVRIWGVVISKAYENKKCQLFVVQHQHGDPL